ncbi:MAG: bifunctional phosphopantothenoylcysteine decarboxylase/phosphopantothenate--cysteine ligase CoaBC [Saprospiraceae bacterium]|nr:bifunctional phosphopantothenoylcysteine decarboxylase/phosphopantothenate--cysteine ligase CoaBC [Saprospiraceae bacterium]MDW8484981.1 bifunctional phosphopantothenoylcysteine decarboxylase/phosphopantothenate--cysteine ligase CoaBC [Saprospiraceae bacterium]
MRKIVLGVSGSIAAYKAAHLVRLLVKRGDEVRVIMTPAATTFITPLTLSTLSKHSVITEVSSELAWNNHVELGLWADAYLIAPATANTLAKMANGLCDSIVTAVYLSARCPVFVAPAMDVDMWHHPATQANLERLRAQGVGIIPVSYGELASGLVGEGRMAEPEDIVEHLDLALGSNQILQGLKALVTAGPTYEVLDPVRFIGNFSTGRMGIAIAEALARKGAEVVLVLGPTHLRPRHVGVQVVPVVSAQDMYEACSAHFPDSRIAVLAAAVADYKPLMVSETKMKKQGETIALTLVETIDIAAQLGRQKRSDQLLVGFALETDNEEFNAWSKLEKKNFDFIVLNSLRHKGAGFGLDTNRVTILRRNGTKTSFELKSKSAVAEDIVQEIVHWVNLRSS